jgi:hypothetical protein
MCDKNTDQDEKKYCYDRIVYDAADFESCKLASNPTNCMLSSDRDKTHTRDELIGICESLSDSGVPMAKSDDKRFCYQELAKHLDDIDMCKLGWNIMDCIIPINVKLNDIYSYDKLYGYCELTVPLSVLGKEYAVEACRLKVIQWKNDDINRCDTDLTDKELKFFCYMNFAAHACYDNDKTVCGLIEDVEAKTMCIDCGSWEDKYRNIVESYQIE